jgi:K+-transporting ATPase KdpF subunit
LGCWRSGVSRRPASGCSACGHAGERAWRGDGIGERGPPRQKKRSIMFDYIVSGVVAVLLLVYLGWAMFQPEKF